MGAKKKRAGSLSASKTEKGSSIPGARDLTEAEGASKAGDPAHEIDEIFSRGKAQRKRKLQEEEQLMVGEAEPVSASDSLKKKSRAHKAQKRSEEEGVPSSSPPPFSKPRKKTKEGLSVYTEEELGWNRKNAGGTPLCPFDCDCCF